MANETREQLLQEAKDEYNNGGYTTEQPGYDQGFSEKIFKAAIIVGAAASLVGGRRSLKGLFNTLTGSTGRMIATSAISSFAATSMISQDNDLYENMRVSATLAVAMTLKKPVGETILRNASTFINSPIARVISNTSKTIGDYRMFRNEISQRLFREGESIKEIIADPTKLSDAASRYRSLSIHENINTLSDWDQYLKGQQIDSSYADYFKLRKASDDDKAGIKLGLNALSTVGRYTSFQNGQATINVSQLFLDENNTAQNLTTLFDNYSSQTAYLNKNNLFSFFDLNFQNEGTNLAQNMKNLFIKKGDTTNVTFGDIKNIIGNINDSGKEDILQVLKEKNLVKQVVGDGGTYEWKHGNLLDDAIFNRSILLKDKTGTVVDKTWFNPSNIINDAGRFVEHELRAVFKIPIDGKINKFSPLKVLGFSDNLYKNLSLNDGGFKYYTNGIDYKSALADLADVKNKYDEYRDIVDFGGLNRYQLAAVAKKHNVAFVDNKEDLDVIINQLDQKWDALNKEYLQTQHTTDWHTKQPGFEDDANKQRLIFSIKKEIQPSDTSKQTSMKYYIKETRENTEGSFFLDGNLYIREFDGNIRHAGANRNLTASLDYKKQLTKKAGFYATHNTNSIGYFIPEDTVTKSFNIRDFKDAYNTSPSEAFKYILNSDINFLSKKNGYNTEKGIPMQVYDAVGDFFKLRGLAKKPELKQYLKSDKYYKGFPFGLSSTAKWGSAQYDYEVDSMFDLFQNKYNETKNKIIKFIQDDKAAQKYLFGTKKLSGLSYNEVNDSLRNMSHQDFINNFFRQVKTIPDGELFATMKEAQGVAFNNYRTSVFRDIEDFTDPKIQEVKNKLGRVFDMKFLREEIISQFYKSSNGTAFESLYGEKLKKNLFFNRESFEKRHSKHWLQGNKDLAITEFGSGMIPINSFQDLKTNINELWMQLVGFDKNKGNKVSGRETDVSLYLNTMLDRMEDTLASLGVGRLNPNENGAFGTHLANMIIKRVLPGIALYSALSTVNGLSDVLLPDEIPIVGNGIGGAIAQSVAGVHVALQEISEKTGILGALQTIERKFPGFVENGILSPLRLTSSPNELIDIYFKGKPIEVKKNRFWFSSGKQSWEGESSGSFRPHLLYLAGHRDAGIYANKVERFFRQDFAFTRYPWIIADPYKEEREHNYAMSEQLFEHMPIIGGLMNATLGELIKPTKLFRKNEWYINDKVMLNPEYNGQDNTPKFINYTMPNKFLKVGVDAFEDFKTWAGMPGFIMSAATKIMFGKQNPYEYETMLRSVDKDKGINADYYNMELGGMFGMTEPIRRLIIKDRYKTDLISPLINNELPDWIPNNNFNTLRIGDINSKHAFARYNMPGKEYENTYGLHSDELGRYGLLDRLRILAVEAPTSKEFKSYKSLAMQNILNSRYNDQDATFALESLSLANEKQESGVNENIHVKTDLSKMMLTPENVTGLGEFIAEGKRYKLSGIEGNFNNIAYSHGGDVALNEIKNLNSKLMSGNSIEAYTSKNPLSSVKTDNKGEYIEVYAPSLVSDMNSKQSYLSNAYNNGGVISAVGVGHEFFNNFYKSGNFGWIDKMGNQKDAYSTWYYNNTMNPTYKDWLTPYESFVQPVLDFASEGHPFVPMGALMDIAPTDSSADLLLPTMKVASFLGGLINGPNRIKRYDKESEMQNKIEYAEHVNGQGYKGGNISSIYDMTGQESLSKMKSYLTLTERKYFKDLVNEVDPEKRDMIYNKASDRLKKALGATWQQQSDYVGGDYVAPVVNLPTYDDVPIMQLTNDETYNAALIQTYYGKNISGYSQKSMSEYLFNENNFTPSAFNYIDSKLTNKYNTKNKELGTYGYKNGITFNIK